MKNRRTKTIERNRDITNLQLRMLGSYAIFQLLNLINLLIGMLIGACLLAFVLALRGQVVSSLLPWFLLIAAPIWIGGSYWSYSLLIRHGVLRSSPSLEAESGIDEAPEPNDEQAAEPANDAENSDRLLSKVTPLRRLFSL